MKSPPDPRLAKARIRRGQLSTPDSYENSGNFYFKGPRNVWLYVIAGDGRDDDGTIHVPWEHVSISCKVRTPTWEEMCFVKDLFWSEDECVIQFHPPRSEYVNVHPHCLHLWKPLDVEIALPPRWTLA